jgi:hypothetical protein
MHPIATSGIEHPSIHTLLRKILSDQAAPRRNIDRRSNSGVLNRRSKVTSKPQDEYPTIRMKTTDHLPEKANPKTKRRLLKAFGEV